MREREPPASKPDTPFPPIRALRSLAWNRKMLPVIQARLERAESVVRAYLLLNGNEGFQIGLYQISMNENDEIGIVRRESNDWYQLPLPESRLPSADSLEDTVETSLSEVEPINNSEEEERV